MAEAKDVVPPRDEAQQLIRVQRELDEVRQRLEEETAYYRAELEASRQRRERDETRLQADEVARRRRVEEQLAAASAELQRLRVELAEALQQNGSLSSTLDALTAAQAAREEAAVAAERRAARDAWQEAEREVARQEQELEAMRQLLAEEQQRRQRAEELALQWEQEAVRGQSAEQEAAQLIVSLKKALWNTAHARRRAETALVTLRSELQARPTQADEPKPLEGEIGDGLKVSGDGYNEISQEALKSVFFFGDASEDLADEFLLTTADASLDQETVGQLRAAALPPPAPPTPIEPAPAPAPVLAEPTAPTAGAAASEPAAPVRRRGSKRGQMLLAGLAVIVAGLLWYWLIAGGFGPT